MLGNVTGGGIGSGLKTPLIPKTPIMVTQPKTSSSLSGFFILISIIITVTSGAIYGGVFYYRSMVQAQITSFKSDIVKIQDSYGDQAPLIQKMATLDKKLKIARNLIDGHATLIPLFKLVSDSTIKSVRFKDFNFTNADNKKIDVKMSGEAKSYSSIALQSKEFADSKQFSNIVFSDLNPSPTGNVVFRFAASVKPTLVSYSEFLKNQ